MISLKKRVRTISPSGYEAVKNVVQSIRYRIGGPASAASAYGLAEYVYRCCDGAILSGPFMGMKYNPLACGSALTPKLIGTYESELHPWIYHILADNYSTIIDIGCAEGYYAIGFAMFCQSRVSVIAYDLDPTARDAARELAILNGVNDRVEIRTECSWQELATAVQGKSLVFCDIEGAELDLLDPAQCPQLLRASLLVECHDGRKSDAIQNRLKSRFEATHRIREATHRHQRSDEFSFSKTIPLSRQWKAAAVGEGRCFGLNWLFMEPRSESAT